VLVAEHFGPGVNWASKVDLTTGVPVRDSKYGTTAKENTTGICPAAIGYKDQQPAAFSPKTGFFYVPTNNICMDYEGVEVQDAVGHHRQPDDLPGPQRPPVRRGPFRGRRLGGHRGRGRNRPRGSDCRPGRAGCIR